MNALNFQHFRLTTLCRLLAVGSLVAGLGLTGCGAAASGTDSSTTGGDDTSGDGSVATDEDAREDATDQDGSTDHPDTTDQGDTTDHDVPADVSDTTGGDTAATDTDSTTGDADAGKPDTGPPLPLCKEAKGSCALCTLCPAYPVCTIKAIGSTELKTYPNDCAAICALNAVNWPAEVNGQVWPTECPACPACTPADMKNTTPDQWCVTLENGSKVTVDHKCEIACVANPKLGADGKTPVTTKGPCKSKCTDPVASGGAGCKVGGQPVCATQDNKTYTNTCKMQNCNVSGCFAEGETAASSQCAPNAMTKECDGSCFDKTKTPNCTAECAPVCGIKQVTLGTGAKLNKGITYRSECVAAADGATVGKCDGISNTPSDICAAAVEYKNKGCCEDVEYGIIHPVCGSQTQTGKPDLFVTFQNQGEFDCLTKGDPSWTFQYASACICSCNNFEALVCGDDGFTYQNACQAKCFNGDTFGYQNGPCQQ